MYPFRPDPTSPCFSVSGLTFSYPDRQPALKDVSFNVPRGQFVLLCGTSGSGKSTLLRLLKPSMTPGGTVSGEIRFQGSLISDIPPQESAARIAFVGQSPDAGIITDRVWHELAFGAESLGWDKDQIRARVAETASFFGLSELFHRECAALSGGQKQLVCLASAMVLRPDVLLLDEPTAQLDPIAAEQFLGVLRRVNTELGVTVLLSEHRLEQVFPLCDRVLVLENGALTADDRPDRIPGHLTAVNSPMRYAMPCAARIFCAVTGAYPALASDTAPITVREGSGFLQEAQKVLPSSTAPGTAPTVTALSDTALTAHELYYRYPDTTEDVLRGCSLTVPRGACYAILGANGAGKSTALSVLAGVRRPDSGTVQSAGRVRLLPQNPALLLTEPTIRASLAGIHARSNPTAGKTDVCFSEEETAVLSLCGLLPLLDRHPRDLSGGELQRAALAAVLLSLPGWSESSRCTDILLLDEPTKGTDAAFRRQLGALLSHLRTRGMTVVLISHDLEFCAENATECAMFFDGTVTAAAPPRRFFAQNRFYTTAAHRMSAALYSDCVTPDDILRACGITPEPPPAPVLPAASPNAAVPTEALRSPAEEAARIRKNTPKSRLRRAASCVLFALALVLFVCISRFTDLHTLTEFASGASALPPVRDMLLYGAFTASLLAAVFLLPGRAASPHEDAVIGVILPPEESTPPKPLRLWLSCAFLWLCIPATLALGITHLGVRGYMTTSLLVLFEGMLPFFLLFEGRRPGARRVALIACLCALGVAGRAAFFMLPQFKPVLALVILAGAALGAQTGFLCGALTMLLSNMLFGQGPWTPWQMFAMGMSGFLAGLLFCRKSAKPPRRLPLCIFGAVCAALFYGPVMNFSSALIWGQSLTPAAVLPFFITGFPLDCIHAAATVLFLYILGGPVAEQLLRIRTKYRF